MRGDTAVMRGDIELMGGSPQSPPLGKTLYLDISEKSHVSRLYNSVYPQPILDCNVSHSKFKHPKSQNDTFKPVSEIVSPFQI